MGNKFLKQILIVNKWGLFIGPLLFCIIYFTNLPLVENQKTFLAIFTWVVCQWLFSSIPLFITGLFGVSLSVILGVTKASEAFTPFSSSIIFLFMGGFLFAKAMEVLRFDRKLSLMLLANPLFSGSLKKTTLGIYLLTAFFSMWVSNTATMAMMLPIILGILKSLKIEDPKIKCSLLLGTAYAATIGGLGTPIGSPPNILALGMLKDLAEIEFGFFKWTLYTSPIVIIMLTILYFSTSKTIGKDMKIEMAHINEELKKLHGINRHEVVVMILFILMVSFWFAPSILQMILGSTNETVIFLKSRFPSGVVSVFFASLLFVLPLVSKIKILNLQDAKEIDWPSLFLFGSGLALGSILFKTGLATTLSQSLLSGLNQDSFTFIMIAVIFFTIFTTELASNTAAANILIPIIIAASQQAGLSPITGAILVAISCNLAFMLPVATPPNAIIYGSGHVNLQDMVKAGLKLNIISIILLSIIAIFIL